MAQRFGGKYSPNGNAPDGSPTTAPQAGGPQPGGRPMRVPQSRAAQRAKFLFFPPLAFLIPAFAGNPDRMILSLIAGGLLLLAAWFNTEGVKAQEAYDIRRVARRPAIPRKLFAAGLTGVGLFTGGMITQTGLLHPILFGLAGVVLHFAAFGADPLKNKGMEGVDEFQTARVARAVDEAEGFLAGMKDAILRANDRALEGRVDRFAATARTLFRTIEGDPGDLTAARKYLTVYLMGARDATVKFADHYAQSRDPEVRASYEALLGDLETTFAERTKSLLSGSHTDLDVEIEVLRDRLKLET